MQIFRTITDWQDFRRELTPSLSLGFVPTMGNLHAGHASLFEKSKQNNDLTAVSVFINPTQFNQADDYTHYPRTLEADLNLLEDNGVDYCLLPDEKAMYAEGYRYQIEENTLSLLMEGQQRPGHFNGVLTVVMKLLNLVKPTIAYFGEKDYQQYLLINDLVRDFFMDVRIQPCPTIREPSGLAYSSRNSRLNSDQRALAETFAHIFHQKKSCEQLINELQHKGIQVEYLLDYASRRFVAVTIGTIRLIDNYGLN